MHVDPYMYMYMYKKCLPLEMEWSVDHQNSSTEREVYHNHHQGILHTETALV